MFIKQDFRVAWPSGLRRWFKAPVSSGAWVRIPLLPGILYCVQKLSITFSLFHYKNLVVTSPPQLMKGLSSYFQGMSPKGWVNMIIGPFYWILKTKPFHGCSKRCIMNIHKGTLGVEPRTCRTAAGCSTTELYPLSVFGEGQALQTPALWRKAHHFPAPGTKRKRFVRNGIWTHAL